MCARRENAGRYVGVLGGLALLLAVGCAGSDLDQHKDNPTGQMPDVVGKWTLDCVPAAADCPTLQIDVRQNHIVKVSGSSQDGSWNFRNDGTFVMAEFIVTLGGTAGVGSYAAGVNSAPPGHMAGTLQRCADVKDCEKRTAEGQRGWK